MSATVVGALLALGAAVLLNGSYVLQHAGGSKAAPVDVRRPAATLRALLRAPLWSLGAVAGITGWALHLGAMREAPLSLVQAFVAGGLALVAPMLALGLGLRLRRSETQAVALMVVALVGLSVGIQDTGAHARFDAGALAGSVGALAGVALLLVLRRSTQDAPLRLGVAGGLLYSAADLSLKAVTGLGSLRAVVSSPWLPAAVLATAGAFFAFQRGLQSERSLAVIALMTAATNVTSIAGAFLVYGDPLGRTPALQATHAIALTLVLVAAWRLAPTSARLVE